MRICLLATLRGSTGVRCSSPEIFLATVGIEAQSEITPNCDMVMTEYGFFFDDISRRRLLQKNIPTKKYAPITTIGKRIEKNRRRGGGGSNPSATRRSVQENEDDYLILLNGAMSSTYRRSKYLGYWNELIYIIFEDTAEGAVDAFVYADNLGDGAYSIPVIYFPPDVQVDSTILPPMGSVVQDALALGGVFAELTYSTDVTTGLVVSPVSLYVEDGAATYEKPRSQGGFLAPVVYGEVLVGTDIVFPEFIGALHPWGDSITVQPINLDTYGELIGLEFMVFDMYAYDFDKNEDEIGSFDFHYFDFNITDRTLNSTELLCDDDYFDYMFDGSESKGNQNGGKDVDSNDNAEVSNAGTSTSNAASAVPGLVLLHCLLSFLICSWSQNFFI